ncbi:hypothetical protein Forpe1208_v015569 [Fusarium oxysporum f. sp. rapae]|uniref:Uncharacterized protein n=1 Tax=Fusarium oxysporum f. sp. rapae TaxID=485398 RepID=A0A8J5NGD5_FUSOX|nr:hypothetical protein Forpe1208_v015569 [Fusarium oxysporum f. sp. rapae]
MPPRIHKLSRLSCHFSALYVEPRDIPAPRQSSPIFGGVEKQPPDTKAVRLVSYGDLCVVNGQTTLTISLGCLVAASKAVATVLTIRSDAGWQPSTLQELGIFLHDMSSGTTVATI